MRKSWLYVLCIVLLLLITSPGSTQDVNPLLSALPGSLAYIGSDHNVYTLNFADKKTSQLTTDGAFTMQYQWVTWSNDGRLAYFCCDLRTAESPETAAYISEDGVQAGGRVFEGRGESIIYAAWSPGSCDNAGSCRNLALLVNDIFNGTLRVDMAHDVAGTTSIATVAEGAPFYYSWSPDGSQMIFHRNNNSLEIYSVPDRKVVTTLDQSSSGTFQSPAWSPVDNRVLSGIPGDEKGKTSLAVTSDGKTSTPLKNMSGFISFAWSPDGKYIAYRLITNSGFGALFVIDAVTGETISRSLSSGVVAFFWSPDSQKLAYVTRGEGGASQAQAAPARIPVQYVQNNQSLSLVWNTLEIGTGLNRRYTTFSPSEDMVYLLLYFDQFSQSHHVWSPDSSALVYAEIVSTGRNAKSVVDVLDVRQPNTAPVKVADGSFAVWSFN